VTEPHWTEAYWFGAPVEVHFDDPQCPDIWRDGVVTAVNPGVLRVVINMAPHVAFVEVTDSAAVRHAPLK
jgi:hypothetical protein